MSVAEGRDRREKGVQDWVDRSKDGAAIAVHHQRVGHGRDDAGCGVRRDLEKSLIKRGCPHEVDDVSGLHDVPGSHV